MAKKKELDNLATNVLAAEKAGLSYGKYMALKHEKEQPPKMAESPSPPGWKVCPQCGKKFYAEHGKRRYCSEFCHQQANYKAHRDRIVNSREPILPKICAVCGKEFMPFRNDKRIKYCNELCKMYAQNERSKEAHRERQALKRGVKDGD